MRNGNRQASQWHHTHINVHVHDTAHSCPPTCDVLNLSIRTRSVAVTCSEPGTLGLIIST